MTNSWAGSNKAKEPEAERTLERGRKAEPEVVSQMENKLDTPNGIAVKATSLWAVH